MHNVFFRTPVGVYLGLAFHIHCSALEVPRKSAPRTTTAFRPYAPQHFQHIPMLLPFSLQRAGLRLFYTILFSPSIITRFAFASANTLSTENTRVECSRCCYFGDIYLTLMSLKSGQICEEGHSGASGSATRKSYRSLQGVGFGSPLNQRQPVDQGVFKHQTS